MLTQNRIQPPLGQCITQLRSSRYWIQETLAQRSGLSRGMVLALEQGVRVDPRLSTVLRLAKALEVALTDLIHLDDLNALEAASLQEAR